MRLSAHIAKKYNISRRFAKSLICGGHVYCAGSIITSDINIEAGEYIAEFDAPEQPYLLEHFLIKEYPDAVFLYKPALMHTDRHAPCDYLCMDDVVSDSFPDFYLLSRLDYGVDGVIAAIKTGAKAISQEKRYLAWVQKGFPEHIAGNWDVDAHKRRRVRAYLSNNGIYMDIVRRRQGKEADLVEVALEKAHRHQIRAVCAAVGYPIIGDTLYGVENGKNRIFLHCKQVTIDGLSCQSPCHKEFAEAYL